MSNSFLVQYLPLYEKDFCSTKVLFIHYNSGTVLFAPFHLHLFTFFLLHPLITSLPSSIMYTSDYPLCVCFYPLPLCPAQPFIRGPPMDLTVNQSSQATFSCTAQGNPVPTISWTGPSANFTTEVAPGVNFTVLSVLTIDSAVRAVHEGLYTCSASNGVGPSPSSSAVLTVQGTTEDPPPHNTRCTVDRPHQTPAPIALEVSSTSRPHHTLQSCCHVLFLSFSVTLHFTPLFPLPPPSFPVMCSSSFSRSSSSPSLSSPHCTSCPGKDCGYPRKEYHFVFYHLGCLPRGANREHPVDL